MKTQAEDQKWRLLAELEKQTLPGNPLSEAREALKEAADQPFPHRKMEEWKYSPFPAPAIAPVAGSAPSSLALTLDREAFGDACLLVWVNGHFQAGLSDQALPKGVHLETGGIENDWLPAYEKNLFQSLQKATSPQLGIRLRVEPGVQVDQAIGLLFVRTGEPGIWAQPRLQVEVGKGASLSVLEAGQGEEAEGQVSNSLTEIRVRQNACLYWAEFQEVPQGLALVHQNRVETETDSVFEHVVISTGKGYVRNNLEIRIAGENGDVHMYGLALGKEKFHVDNHTFVNHKPEHTTSNQLYKGIFGGKATGVFNGKILVDQPAQKTNAYQSSKNLLCSADARVFAKPQLEIFADDVKCSHGATIGQLDEEPIFYLRSRGLDLTSARMLLLNAFASEIALKIRPAAFREFAEKRVLEELAELSQNAR